MQDGAYVGLAKTGDMGDLAVRQARAEFQRDQLPLAAGLAGQED